MILSTAVAGLQDMRLPQWGRAFWQDPNDDEIFLAYGSGTSEVDFITSTDGGNTWSAPALLFPVEDFHIHNNFDTTMDRAGNIHCGFRFNGSGCYQFMGKIAGGGWTASSGIGPIGLATAGDSAVFAKGFQGSLTMQETPGDAFDGGGVYPVVKMAAKDASDDITAFILGAPYNTVPDVDTVSGPPNAGADGGFPVIYVNSGGDSTIIFYDEPSFELNKQTKSFGTYFEFATRAFGDVHGNVEVPFGPSMAIGSGTQVAGDDGLVLVCSSGLHGVGQGMYASDSSNGYQNIFDSSNDTELNWLAVASGSQNGSSSGIIDSSGIVPTGNMYGIGLNSFSREGVTRHGFPGQGTNCDFSFNDDGEYLLYFQKKDKWGKQCIGRFKANSDGNIWTFPDMNHESSGIKHVATARQSQTGGWSNKLFWGGFKALKHPTEPAGASGTKKELLVTQGHFSAYPSGGILTVWDVADSPALGLWQESEFTFDYTLTSGTANEIFVGIAGFTNLQPVAPSHDLIVGNFFDDDNTTFGRVRDGYTLTLELDAVRTIERIEILHLIQSTARPSIAISGSLDGINHTRVDFIPSGIIFGPDSYNNGNPLLKYQTGPQTVTKFANALVSQPINNIDPFTAKFLTLQFSSTRPTSSANIYEMKIFGPGTTNPETVTWGDLAGGVPNYNRLRLTRSEELRVETFTGRRQGTIPAGWRTYGDFEWAIVASGEATRTGNNTKPTDPPTFDFDGKVPSGIWATTTVGNNRGVGDSFSIRSEAIGDASGLGNPLRKVPVGGIQPGMSGVLEVDINVLQDEIDTDTGFGRIVGFNIRSDAHVDDLIEFFVDDVLQQAYIDVGWNTFNSYTLGVDEFVEPDTFQTSDIGTHTLKWVYTKGTYDPVVDQNIYPFGAAWIDGITGLDFGELESGARNQRYGFLRGENPFELSIIHGYLQGLGFTAIHGFLPSGLPQQSFIHGYLTGLGTEASGQIHGYLLGHEFAASQIHSYLIGNVPIDPTGINSSIHGFALSGFGSGNNAPVSNIHGFLQGDIGGQFIHGFIAGESGTFDNSIRKGFTIGWDGGVFGLGPNQKAIYGYLTTPLESGVSSVHGFLMGNFPISSIHGYMGSEFLVASGGGLVGDPSTSNVIPGVNFIHGYLKGEMGGQFIHGYVKLPLATSETIHGYVLSGKEDVSIHGYLKSFEMATESIHGFASGIGFSSSSIHGYVFGISGIIDESIHGYLIGAQVPTSNIFGTLIGTIAAASSSAACPSHTFPLPPLLSITLPSGFIN